MSYTDYKQEKGSANWHLKLNSLCDQLAQDIPSLQTELQNARGGFPSLDGRFDTDENRIADMESFLEANSSFQAQAISDLDALMQALVELYRTARAVTLPFEYGLMKRGSATFNSTAGVTISLPFTVGDVDDYSVSVAARSSSGFIGEVWVEKATNAFTVYNSGSDTSTEFEYTIFFTLYAKHGAW